MMRKILVALAAVTFVSAVAVSTAADARVGGGGGGARGGGFGGGARGAMVGGGFRGASFGGGFRGARVASFRGAAVGPRSFAFRQGPRVNRFAFARFHRFHRFHRARFAFAAVPFGIGYSCWRWRPAPGGWSGVGVCGYDYY